MFFFQTIHPEIHSLVILILYTVYTINGNELTYEESSRTTCQPASFNRLPAPVPKFTGIPGISNDVFAIYPNEINAKKICLGFIVSSSESLGCATTESYVGKFQFCECVFCAEDETTKEQAIRMANNVLKYMTAISIHLSRVGANSVEQQLRINMHGPQLFQECANTLNLGPENGIDPDELDMYEYIVSSINWGVHPKLYRQVLEIAKTRFNLEEKFCLGDTGTIPHLKCLSIDIKYQHQQYCYFWSFYRQLFSEDLKLDLTKKDSIGIAYDLDPFFHHPWETNKITSNSPYLYTWTLGTPKDLGTIEVFGEPGAVCSDTHGLNVPCLDTHRLLDQNDFPNKSWFLECKLGVCGGPDQFFQKLYTNTKTIFSPTTLTEITGQVDEKDGLGGVLTQLLTNSEKTEPNTYCSVKMWEYAEAKYFEESGIGASNYGTDELIYTFEDIKRKFKWRFLDVLQNRYGNGFDVADQSLDCLKHGFGVKNRKDCVEFTGTIGCLSELPSMTCKRINQDDRCICRGDPKPFNYKEVNGKCVASEDSICTTANGLVPCEEGFECKVAIPVEDELPNVLTPFIIRTCKKISKASKSSKEKLEESKSSIHSKLSFGFISMLNLILTIFT